MAHMRGGGETWVELSVAVDFGNIGVAVTVFQQGRAPAVRGPAWAGDRRIPDGIVTHGLDLRMGSPRPKPPSNPWIGWVFTGASEGGGAPSDCLFIFFFLKGGPLGTHAFGHPMQLVGGCPCTALGALVARHRYAISRAATPAPMAGGRQGRVDADEQAPASVTELEGSVAVTNGSGRHKLALVPRSDVRPGAGVACWLELHGSEGECGDAPGVLGRERKNCSVGCYVLKAGLSEVWVARARVGQRAVGNAETVLRDHKSARPSPETWGGGMAGCARSVGVSLVH